MYRDLGESQVVHTSWALLALIAAGWARRDVTPLERASRYLMRAQLPSGDWPQQHITGVFNRNCVPLVLICCALNFVVILFSLSPKRPYLSVTLISIL